MPEASEDMEEEDKKEEAPAKKFFLENDELQSKGGETTTKMDTVSLVSGEDGETKMMRSKLKNLNL